MEEIEVKYLDINVQEVEQKLRTLGATKVFDRIYKRIVFDYPDKRLDQEWAWVRLRDEGDQVTLTYKKRIGANSTAAGDQGMEEIEIIVSDFFKTATIFHKIGFIEKFYEENRRIRYQLQGIEFDIDHWPLITPYLEIEASSWEEIDRGIALLGFAPEDKKIFSTMQVYERYGINENEYQVLTFEKQVKKEGV